MKAKSRSKHRKDNETPSKPSSDDSRSNVAENDVQMKAVDLYTELKITPEMIFRKSKIKEGLELLKKKYEKASVRKELAPEDRKLPTKRYCVLKRAPDDVGAVRPFSSMVDQDGGVRIDDVGRVVEHSILGSSEEFFRIALSKRKIRIEDVPVEYHHNLGYGEPRRPISAMYPAHAHNYATGKMKQHDKSSRATSRISGHINREDKLKDPDTSALKLWEKRMKERRTLQNHISKTVERTPDKLIFNSGDLYRTKCEVDYLISKSIPYFGTGQGFRTGSEFWNQHEEVGVDPELTIHMTNTLSQKGFPPPILHIGVPDRVRKERGEPTNSERIKVNKGDFFHERYEEVQEIVKELNPHFPDLSKLMIEGKKICVEKEIEEEDAENMEENKENRTSLKDDVMLEEIEDYARPITVDYPGLVIDDAHFPSESPLENCEVGFYEIRKILTGLEKTICVETIRFTNYGSSVVRLWWKKMESYDPFNLDNKNNRRFYFSTKDVILLPRKQLDFPIIFKSDHSGIFTERWKLDTIPSIANGKEIIVSLRGIAILDDVSKPLRIEIQKYMKYQVSEKMCLDILDDILEGVHQRSLNKVEDEEDEYMESDEFQFVNNDIIFNYDKVQSIKKLYTEFKSKDKDKKGDIISNNNWDLNCRSFRQALLRTENLKSDKKFEFTDKFYKSIDKLMTQTNASDVSHRHMLFRIGYRQMVLFVDKMYVQLHNLRFNHGLPEMEMKISRERRKTNFGRQKTNMSQVSKSSSKKQSIASTKGLTGGKSREPTSLQLLDTQDTMLNDNDDQIDNTIEESVEIDNLTINEAIVSNDDNIQGNTNLDRYHYKTYQTIHALLNSTIDQILDYWITYTEE